MKVVVAVLLEPGGIFTLKERRTALKPFLVEKMFSFWQELVKTVVDDGLAVSLSPTGTLKLLLPGLADSKKSDWSALNVIPRVHSNTFQVSFELASPLQMFSMGPLPDEFMK